MVLVFVWLFVGCLYMKLMLIHMRHFWWIFVLVNRFASWMPPILVPSLCTAGESIIFVMQFLRGHIPHKYANTHTQCWSRQKWHVHSTGLPFEAGGRGGSDCSALSHPRHEEKPLQHDPDCCMFLCVSLYVCPLLSYSSSFVFFTYVIYSFICVCYSYVHLICLCICMWYYVYFCILVYLY